MIGLLVVASLLAAASAETEAEQLKSPLIYSGYQPYQPYQQFYQPYHGYHGYHGYPGYHGYHGYNYSPYYSLAPVTAPAAAPYTVGSQFHAQDEFGNLNYG